MPRPVLLHCCSIIVIAGVTAAAGCKDRAPEKTRATSAGERSDAPAPPQSQRNRLHPYRPLLDEASRAELDAGGLLIDFGGADQAKYTRGGWRSGWGDVHPATADRPGRAEVRGRRAWLDLMVQGAAPAAIALRARSPVAGQTLVLLHGQTELGRVELARKWGVHRVTLASGALPAGPVRLELRSRASGEVRAEIDWLWLPSTGDAGAEPLLDPRVAPMSIGGKARRALRAPEARTYSFYLQAPAGAHLVADLGAADQATFEITATADGAGPVSLLREEVKGVWVERAVSLGAFAGKPIRLDLATRDQGGAAGWGEPEILVESVAPTPAPPAPGTRPRNVVMIVMDTARADGFGPFGGSERIARTPHFDALAARSTVFTSAYDNENWTKPSVATILSGLYPTSHDTKEDDSELPSDVELLSERLKRDGFATGGFVANGYISSRFGFEQGWDRFENYIREGRTTAARHVYDRTVAWLEEHLQRTPDRPFFLYVQTIDPHVDYDVAEQYWRPYYEGSYRGPLGPTIEAADQVALSSGKIPRSDDNVGWLRALYWGEVAYHDEHMGRFLAELDRLGVRDDSLLIVTNDHGEELGERGRFGHGHQVFEEMVRAPLVMSHGSLPRGHQVQDIVEHVDLAPTILDLLGLAPLAGADGMSFVPVIQGGTFQRPRYAIIEFLGSRRVVRVGTLKLVAHADGGSELHDLAADPAEQRPLGPEAPIARRLGQIHLGEGLAAPDKKVRLQGVGGRRPFRAGKARISGGMRRQLEALGYFGSGPAEGADERDQD